MPNRSPRRGALRAADLNPRRGSEPGKVRPVVVVQSDLLNETDHSSAWILPCTTQLVGENVLRVELSKSMAGNARACEVMIDQPGRCPNQVRPGRGAISRVSIQLLPDRSRNSQSVPD